MRKQSGKDKYLLIYENNTGDVITCIGLKDLDGYLKHGYTIQIVGRDEEIIKEIGPDNYIVPEKVAIKK